MGGGVAGRFRRGAHGCHGWRGDGEPRDRGPAGARTPLTARGGSPPDRAGAARWQGALMSDQIPHVPAGRLQPSASYSFTMPLHMPQHGGSFARVAQAIADAEAMLGAIDLVRVESR